MLGDSLPRQKGKTSAQKGKKRLGSWVLITKCSFLKEGGTQGQNWAGRVEGEQGRGGRMKEPSKEAEFGKGERIEKGKKDGKELFDERRSFF